MWCISRVRICTSIFASSRRRQQHAGVQRLVAVGLGRRDVVLEAAGDHLEGVVDGAQRQVAMGALGHDDAEGHHVAQALEGDVLRLHLAPDRVGRLFPPQHLLHRHAVRLERGAQLGLDLGDDVGRPPAQVGEAAGDGGPGFLVQLAEAQRFQLGLQRLHADALGQRRVDFQRFAGGAGALLRLGHEGERAHVVQPVGQLHQEDAQVLGQRQEELAEVLRLLGALALHLDARQLGDAVHQPRHLGAEAALDLGQAVIGVLRHVVQEGGGERRAVQPVARQDLGHGDGWMM
jgi:hypothetical protein